MIKKIVFPKLPCFLHYKMPLVVKHTLNLIVKFLEKKKIQLPKFFYVVCKMKFHFRNVKTRQKWTWEWRKYIIWLQKSIFMECILASQAINITESSLGYTSLEYFLKECNSLWAETWSSAIFFWQEKIIRKLIM